MKTRAKQATICILVLGLFVLIGWDVLALCYGGEDATISSVIYRTALKVPALSFAAGFVCGHFFWPQGYAR